MITDNTELHTGEALKKTFFSEIPAELTKLNQWMVTIFKPLPGGRTNKEPMRVSDGVVASKTNPKNWSTFDAATAACMRGSFDAIGHVITEADPHYVIDMDDVIDKETGEIHPAAAQVIHAFYSYTERSQSGRGVHIVAKGKKPDFAKCKSRALGFGIEVYDRARFVVITGQRFGDHAGVEERQQELDELCVKLWPGEAKPGISPRGEISTPVDVDDLELLERARQARTGAKFRKLYDLGDTGGYASASEADFGLITMLIFWTAGDRERIIQLFEASGLYRKSKHRDYVRRSVDRALGSYVGPFYRPRSVEKARREEPEDPLTPYVRLLLDPSEWTGRKGPSAYKAYAGMVLHAIEYGIVNDDGTLQVGCDTRTLAEKAGVSKETLSRSALPYLVQEMKLVSWRRGKGTLAGTFVLKRPSPNITYATKISTERVGEYFSGVSYVKHALETLRLLIRMRAGHSRSAKLLRLGMPAMFVTIALTTPPQRGQNITELSERTGRRAYDLRKVLVRLKAAGIAREVSTDVYRLTDDFESAYERCLRESGITYSEREQRRRHDDDRKRRAAKLGVDKPERKLRGKEANGKALAEQRQRAKHRWIEEQRQKVGTTALTFLDDELTGVTAVDFAATRRRWLQRGGDDRELRRAVYFGPFTFRREVDGELSVYREEAA